jgi:hypothetical protein
LDCDSEDLKLAGSKTLQGFFAKAIRGPREETLLGSQCNLAISMVQDKAFMAEKLSEEERASLQAELEHLRQEHRDLDAAIDALTHLGTADRLQLQRLKKRKLALRDRIAFIEDQLTPDIIA